MCDESGESMEPMEEVPLIGIGVNSYWAQGLRAQGLL